ncbi:1024_t:CDS:2, partial [Acaulospora colombiana]
AGISRAHPQARPPTGATTTTNRAYDATRLTGLQQMPQTIALVGEGGGAGLFSHSRNAGDSIRRGPPSGVRSPGSVVSQSERDTSAWESASNATDSTWNNRFAMLGNEDEDTATISDGSDEMDGARISHQVASLVTQDDDDFFPPIQSETIPPWKQSGPIQFVEIQEATLSKSGLLKDRHSKMFKCPVHNSAFELYLYVRSGEEFDI